MSKIKGMEKKLRGWKRF